MRGIRNRELRDLVKLTTRQGWTVRRTNGGHLAFNAPDGGTVYAAATPGGGCRSVANTRAELRRHGADL